MKSADGASDGPETLFGLAKHIVEQCPHLNLLGLMTIGAIQSSYQAKEGEENPDFTALRQCRDALSEALGGKSLQLSMGMSNDFAAAIKSGSDNVRYVPCQLCDSHLLMFLSNCSQSRKSAVRRTSFQGGGEETA